MRRGVDWATSLGRIVRSLAWIVILLPRLAAPLLVIYGVWLFDPRVAYIVAGLILLVMTWPRPDRRTK